ncbi:MAG TPA: peptidase, partial [Byssovorax sp.]
MSEDAAEPEAAPMDPRDAAVAGHDHGDSVAGRDHGDSALAGRDPAAPIVAPRDDAPEVDDIPTSEPPAVAPRSRRALANLGGPVRAARSQRTPTPAQVARVGLAPLAAEDEQPHATPPTSQRRRDSAPAAPRTASPRRAVYPLGGAPQPDPIDDPLANREPPRSPLAVHLSPRMTAIFGGLFGLACITSVIALLIQVVPPKDDRSAAMSASAAAKASGSARVSTAKAVPKKKRTPIPGPWRLSELAKDPTISILSGTPEKKSFVDALSDKGVPTSQVYRVMKALDEVKKFDKVGHKDKFTVALVKGEKKVKAFEYEV